MAPGAIQRHVKMIAVRFSGKGGTAQRASELANTAHKFPLGAPSSRIGLGFFNRAIRVLPTHV